MGGIGIFVYVGIISSRLRKILLKGFYIRIIEFQVFEVNVSLVIFHMWLY